MNYTFSKNRVPIGPGLSTNLPGIDFETYSEAGYIWDDGSGKWKGPPDAPKGKKSKGLPAVGTPVYAEHPSTEILSLAYDLKDGKACKLWLPGMDPPYELFEYLQHGGLTCAWNSAFEFYIWFHVAYGKMQWPLLPYTQLRDTMAKSRRCSLPGALKNSAEVLLLQQQKDSEGTRLINKFSVPRNPTKKNQSKRTKPEDDPADFLQFNLYNVQDVNVEGSINNVLPDLTDYEQDLWLLDQKINFRGVHIDKEMLNTCLSIARQARDKYTEELQRITNGVVTTPGELQKIIGFLAGHSVYMNSLDADHIEEALKRTDLPPVARRVLEIRSSLGSASIKKLYAIERQLSYDSRLRDLFVYCGADRTGRWSGQGPQPQNLPSSGPKVMRCENYLRRPANGGACLTYPLAASEAPCGAIYGAARKTCPDCGAPEWAASSAEWCIEAVERCLRDISTGDLAHVEREWGDAVAAVCGCLRALFSAGPGAELICSDFSAIEAVVLAVLAGEQWRIDLFRGHGKIYEKTASDITGVPLADILDFPKNNNGAKHPHRKPCGKIPELASGYQGAVGAWIQFGADEYMTEEEILANVKKWRAANPNIVNFWYKIEDAAILAVRNPGQAFSYHGIAYQVGVDPNTNRKVLFCQLPSGRLLWYWDPELGVNDWDKPAISYMGWNTDYKKGPVGWMRLDTYGGKLTENIVQAVSRDLLAHAMKNLEAAGYAIVLHVHDEIVAEVKTGTGSIEEFEKIMSDLPAWAAGWPVKAAGGWRGQRYRKD